MSIHARNMGISGWGIAAVASKDLRAQNNWCVGKQNSFKVSGGIKGGGGCAGGFGLVIVSSCF